MKRSRIWTLVWMSIWASSASGDPIHLDAAQLAQASLVVAPLAGGVDAGEIDAFARVLDPTPLFDLALARSTAASSAERARRERVRVRRLSRGEDNASVRELEAAEDEDLRARLGFDAAQARLAAAWGDAVADLPDLDALLTRLANRSAALARIDVPAGIEVHGDPSALTITTATQRPDAVPAHLLGALPATDPVLQGAAWLALIDSRPPPFGTALHAHLSFPGRSMHGVVVPASAIVRLDGEACVYVELAAGTYERRAIDTSRPHGRDWLVGDPLRPGDRVVVTGAQAVRAAELAASDASEAP